MKKIAVVASGFIGSAGMSSIAFNMPQPLHIIPPPVLAPNMLQAMKYEEYQKIQKKQSKLSRYERDKLIAEIEDYIKGGIQFNTTDKL